MDENVVTKSPGFKSGFPFDEYWSSFHALMVSGLKRQVLYMVFTNHSKIRSLSLIVLLHTSMLKYQSESATVRTRDSGISDSNRRTVERLCHPHGLLKSVSTANRAYLGFVARCPNSISPNFGICYNGILHTDDPRFIGRIQNIHMFPFLGFFHEVKIFVSCMEVFLVHSH